MSEDRGVEDQELDGGRLWAGGASTALVAGLVAVVGILVSRGLLQIPVLAPKGEGAWGNANTVTYALSAAAAALAATGLRHLLSVTTPSAGQFFGWIMVLMTLIAVVIPLSLVAELDSKIATAVINLAIGLAITSLVNSVAANARRYRARRARPPAAGDWQGYPPTREYPPR
jgi:hypothetical protein